MTYSFSTAEKFSLAVSQVDLEARKAGRFGASRIEKNATNKHPYH
jgi:hypothetical protein